MDKEKKILEIFNSYGIKENVGAIAELRTLIYQETNLVVTETQNAVLDDVEKILKKRVDVWTEDMEKIQEYIKIKREGK